MPIRSKRTLLKAASVAFFFTLFTACQKEEPVVSSPQRLNLPPGFPEVEFPEDNPLTEASWQLGEKLFFETKLSRDSSISCASCHKAEFALADNTPVSPGVDGRLGTRNTPSLFNVAYHPYFTREGGLPTLEMQVLVPIQEHAEMDFNIVDVALRLQQDPEYVRLAREAYDQEVNPFVITRALGVFERTLLSGNSAVDRFERGELTALTAQERRGRDLFNTLHCTSCHGGFLYTSHAFENNGLDSAYTDPGRFRLTGDSADLARFKTPSLRLVGQTAPYMHDGRFETLLEVVQHYNTGGANHPNKSELITPLGLTQQEMADLVAFLEVL